MLQAGSQAGDERRVKRLHSFDLVGGTKAKSKWESVR